MGIAKNMLIYVCALEYGEFFQGNIYLEEEKSKWANCVGQLGNSITWNLKYDNDTQLSNGIPTGFLTAYLSSLKRS